MVKVSLVVIVLVIGLKVVKWSSNGVGTKDLLEHDFGVYQLLHRSRRRSLRRRGRRLQRRRRRRRRR